MTSLENKRLNAVADERGFTIIEVMVAIVILLLGVLGVATMADTANVQSTTSKARVGATNLAREVLEDARTFKYADISGTVPAASGGPTNLEDAYANIGLTDAAPSTTGFQVIRRGTTYTIVVFSCVFDDSHDGVRLTASPDVDAAGPYCLGSATSANPATDANADDARKLEVKVSWTIQPHGAPSCRNAGATTTTGATGGIGRACVVQSELIANPSGGLGPAIKTMTQDASTPGVIENLDHVMMDVVTGSGAQSLTWSADDGTSGTGTAVAGDTTGTQWNFTWGTFGTSSPSDGTHILTAQAFLFTAGGVPKDAAVSLNRFIPGLPHGTVGGVDTRITGEPAAPLSWLPNSDSDILGYTVYRAAGTANATPDLGNDTAVCSTSGVSATACFDAPGASPDLSSFATSAACPSGSPAGDKCINYYVVAFDQKWTTITNPSAYTAVECPNTPWTTVTVPSSPHSVAPLTSTPGWSTARAGCPSAFITIDYTLQSANAQPDPPVLPTTCATDTGQPVIGWTPPTNPGNYVSYRIYRDPTTTPDPRYNDPATTINFGTVTSFKDPNPTGTTGHEYYVTTVDDQFQESSPLHIHWDSGTCP